MEEINGLPISPGIAIGEVYYLSKKKKACPEYTIEQSDKELKRFEEALFIAKEQLKVLNERALKSVGKQSSMIFEFHSMLLSDKAFIDHIKKIIKHEHKNCEYAVKMTAIYYSEMFNNLDDEYMRERSYDIIDLSNKLMNILMSEPTTTLKELDKPVILAAREILPSEILCLDRDKVLGIISKHASLTSHASIIARTMGIPYVANMDSALECFSGKNAVIDGETGKFIVEPDDSTISQYRSKKMYFEKHRLLLQNQKGLPTVTKDGKTISLFANIGKPDDIEIVKENDAEGIGMLKSEYIFIDRKVFPDEDEQFASYKAVVESMHGKKTCICTMDVGSDKNLSFFNYTKEANPALGLRGTRFMLENPSLLKTQLRAIYRVSAYGDISILFPMITSVEEVKSLKKTAEEVKKELLTEGIPFSPNVRIGIIIETPAAAIISDILAKEVDYFCIGSNDLTQYTLALDRNNENLSNFYLSSHKPILRLIKMIINNAHNANIKVYLCGEFALDQRFTEKLLRYGIDGLWVVPSEILEIRAKIRSIDLTKQKEDDDE